MGGGTNHKRERVLVLLFHLASLRRTKSKAEAEHRGGGFVHPRSHTTAVVIHPTTHPPTIRHDNQQTNCKLTRWSLGPDSR